VTERIRHMASFRAEHDPASQNRAKSARRMRLKRFFRSGMNPGTYVQALRLLNYYSYSHVQERSKIAMGADVRFSPNVIVANGERISIGARSHIGAKCYLWAGDHTGRIDIGEYALFGPEVFVTASNYRYELGDRVMDQPKAEADVKIGSNSWLGARVMVMPGVEIGEGAVIGAQSVVTSSIPPWTVAVGVPAKVVSDRERTQQP